MVQECWTKEQYVPHVLMYIKCVPKTFNHASRPPSGRGLVDFSSSFSVSELAFSPGSILECSGSSVSVLWSVEIWDEGWDGMVWYEYEYEYECGYASYQNVLQVFVFLKKKIETTGVGSRFYALHQLFCSSSSSTKT